MHDVFGQQRLLSHMVLNDSSMKSNGFNAMSLFERKEVMQGEEILWLYKSFIFWIIVNGILYFIYY
jgi:hypothetical protein